MQYLLLIHSDESRYPELSEEDTAALMADHGAFTEALREAEAFVGSHRLQFTSSARTVRVRGGDTIATDGPYAETKEQLGGYYLIEAPDLDAAVAWAARVPSARYGAVEVRPVWEMPGD